MNNPEEIKRIISPVMVAQRYLGQGRQKGNKIWYKSPFRNERMPSFMVDNKSFHDFGDGWDGDIINFIERYYNTDFKNAMKILTSDFGLQENERISKDLEQYIKRQREEKMQMKRNLDNWFNSTLSQFCDELHLWKKIIPYLVKDGLAVAYQKEQYLDYLIDIFVNAKEDEKLQLWKDKEEIGKCLYVKNVKK